MRLRFHFQLVVEMGLDRDSRFTTAVLRREFLCQFGRDFDSQIDFICLREVHAHTVVGCLRLYADALVFV